jgi:hypothetical protein
VASIVLTTQINCCSDKKNTTITPVLGQYVILPTLFDTTWTKLKDGIYHIELELTFTDGSKKKESGCIFVDCTLLCKLVSFMANNPDSKAYSLYELIKFGENCSLCDCSDLCLLYNKLIKEVNLKQEHDCSCG